MQVHNISFLLAFTAGILSFVSPCVLPLVPSYISYISGFSIDELRTAPRASRTRWITLGHSLLFVAGFTTVFTLLGASATMLGQWFLSNQDMLRRIGGLLVIFFGLYILGVLKIPFLMAERRLHFKERPEGKVGSFLIGIAFAAGWTPCVGPILGAILTYAGTTQSISRGILLLLAYSAGLAMPLLIISVGVETFFRAFSSFRKHLRYIEVVSGLLLITVGVLLFTDSLTAVSAFLTKHGIGWYFDK